MRRTIPILLPNDSDLVATIKLFTQIANEVSEMAFKLDKVKRWTLRRQFYSLLRQKYPTVNSRVLEYALRVVTGCYTAKKRRKMKSKEPVRFKQEFALFDKRLFTLKFKGTTGECRIWTVAGRKTLPFTLPPVSRFKEWWKQKEDVDSMVLKVRNGKIIAHACLTIPDRPSHSQTTLSLNGITMGGKDAVGVDLGAEYPLIAVRSDGAIFCPDYSKFHQKRKKFLTLRQQLQRKLTEKRVKGENARSVVRKLKKLSQKQRRFTKQFIRWVVKRFLDWAGDAIIIMETLMLPQGKKKRGAKALNRTLSLMPYGLVKNTIKDLSEERGLMVVFVPPAGTSQTCPVCRQKGERPKRDLFVCPHCGHSEHADIVGARNVLLRGLERFSQSGAEAGDKPAGLCQPLESLPVIKTGGGNPTIVPERVKGLQPTSKTKSATEGWLQPSLF